MGLGLKRALARCAGGAAAALTCLALLQHPLAAAAVAPGPVGPPPPAAATLPTTTLPAATFAPLEAPFPRSVISPRLHCLSRGDPSKKYVALTFDDGPKPETTLQLLSVLERSRIPATFFYVGSQCKKYPDLVKDTYYAGNEIGNHSYHHYRMPTLKSAEKVSEIDDTQAIISELIGIQPRFFRPPGGHRDAEAETLLVKRGMVTAMWDISLNDADSNVTPGDILRQVQDKIRPGSVILAHSGIPATMEAVPLIVHNLTARGYTFVTLSQLANGLEAKNAGHGRGQAGLSNACFRPAKSAVKRKHGRPAVKTPKKPGTVVTTPAEDEPEAESEGPAPLIVAPPGRDEE